jgi:hypothetical protein
MRRFMLAVVVLALVGSASIAAAGTTTYHGTFSGPVVYKGCGGAAPEGIAGGTWNVALHGSTDATVSFDIFVNRQHHVSYGGTVPQIAPEKGQAFAVQFETQAGTLTVSLAGTALTYRISPYTLSGINCRGVTYSGTLGP